MYPHHLWLGCKFCISWCLPYTIYGFSFTLWGLLTLIFRALPIGEYLCFNFGSLVTFDSLSASVNIRFPFSLLLAFSFIFQVKTGSMMMNQVSIFWQLRFESQLSIVAADLWHVSRLSFFRFELSTKLLSKHDQVSPFIAVRIMLKEGKEGTLCLMKKLGYWVF